MTDEHVLLALAFTQMGIGLLVQRNLDPDEGAEAALAGVEHRDDAR